MTTPVPFPGPEALIQMLRNGGCIVSTNDLSTDDIAQARACNHMWVDSDGFGYVYLPSMVRIASEIRTA